MKEKELVILKNKVESIAKVLQVILNEHQNLMVLSTGTLQTIKLMPGYEEAMNILKEKAELKNDADKQ
jgi:hypothetical protein